MDQQNWPSYKQIYVCLSDGQSAISLQNGFMLYVGFKTPLHTLYNVSELAPLLQGYMPLCCVVVPG